MLKNRFMFMDQAPAPGGGTPPATPPAATPPAATPPADWTASLGDELKGYVQTKGFKEPKDVLESYRNFEKLQGVPKERLLHLPESMESAEMAAVWERLGKPKEAKEYTFEIPKEHGDEKLAETMKEVFHKNNVPRAQAEGVVKAWNEYQATRIKEQTDAMNAEIVKQDGDLKKEWGNAYDQNKNIVDQAALKLGLKEDQLRALGAAMGPAAAMKFLHKLGQGIGEDGFKAGNTRASGELTPAMAQAEIRQLRSDVEFSRRLQSKDSDATNKWNRLHQQAFPGEMTI